MFIIAHFVCAWVAHTGNSSTYDLKAEEHETWACGITLAKLCHDFSTKLSLDKNL